MIRVHGAQPQGKPSGALGSTAPPQGVILIMCDTLRKDHLPMYGHKRDTSPNLAKLASQGALFLDNVTQATWTKVSTPSIMTGMYPKSHQVHDFQDRVSAAADTLVRHPIAGGLRDGILLIGLVYREIHQPATRLRGAAREHLGGGPEIFGEDRPRLRGSRHGLD